MRSGQPPNLGKRKVKLKTSQVVESSVSSETASRDVSMVLRQHRQYTKVGPLCDVYWYDDDFVCWTNRPDLVAKVSSHKVGQSTISSLLHSSDVISYGAHKTIFPFYRGSMLPQKQKRGFQQFQREVICPKSTYLNLLSDDWGLVLTSCITLIIIKPLSVCERFVCAIHGSEGRYKHISGINFST